MDYVEQQLAQNERIVFVTRQHWISLLPVALRDLGIAIVIIALSIGGASVTPSLLPLGLLLLLFPLGHFLIRFIGWRNQQYIVTNRRVMEVRGVYMKRVSDSWLEKVNDVVTKQGMLGQLLDYGDVQIITGADIGVDVFRRVAHPIQFKIAMMDQKAIYSERPAEFRSRDVPDLRARLNDPRRRGLIT
ncbi:PH domain-containing protein [Thermogutta sp.]|uniref:PH domain-containing protein n=1 Tax=Thermogutta sp. TaxID=1962930 RepID=UPI0032206BDF